MSDTDRLTPIPVTTMGGLVSILDGADVPFGSSPDCRDVQFFPGNVRTRAGTVLLHQLTPGVDVPYLVSYITPDLVPHLLMWDGGGNMWKEITPGVHVLVSNNYNPDSIYTSITMFGREWIAESDGIVGRSLPTVYDNVNLYVIGNTPPAKNPTPADYGTIEPNPTLAPVAALITAPGNLSIGNYSYKTVLVTADGTVFTTQASPVSNVVAVAAPGTAGKIQVSSIATGSGAVVKRRIYRTLAGGATYYYVGYVNDNTTTTYVDNLADAQVDITKTEPAANTSGAGQIAPGERQVVAFFESADGALSTPSPPGGWTALGGLKVLVTNIPIWPTILGERPVVKRHLAFTPAGGGVFYYIAGTMDINDNTTTSLLVDFNEEELVAGEDISRLFENQIPFANTDFQGQLGVGAYDRRLLWWGGNPLFGEEFRASLVRWSDPDDPEFYDNVDGLMNVSENDGQGIKAGFALRTRYYFVKDNSLHSTQDDGVNPPSKWQVEIESATIGTPSVHGARLGEDWAVIAHRSGLYYFNGGEPIKISQEIQPTWDSINWTFGHRLWVRVDVQRKRIYVGAPFCLSPTVNIILMCDYQEGILVDPIANEGRGRKWCPWFINAAHGNFIIRTNLDSRFLIGMVASGQVREMRNSVLNDNGVAINSYYRTAYAQRPEAGRQLFGMFTCLARGDGLLNFATIRQGWPGVAWLPMAMTSPSTKDLEKLIDVQAERISLRLGTNAIDKWFSIAKLVLWSMEHPFAKHRGTNA